MNKKDKSVLFLFLRYAIILVFGIGNFYILYKILTPITIHSTNIIIRLFVPTVLSGDIIHFGHSTIEIAPPCVAGAAFFLLIALLLSIPDVKIRTRLYAIATAILSLLFINIMRILILAPLTNVKYFEIIHWVFWNVLSTIFVVGIYLAVVKYYKIKNIPVYSDLKYIWGFIV